MLAAQVEPQPGQVGGEPRLHERGPEGLVWELHVGEVGLAGAAHPDEINGDATSPILDMGDDVAPQV